MLKCNPKKPFLPQIAFWSWWFIAAIEMLTEINWHQHSGVLLWQIWLFWRRILEGLWNFGVEKSLNMETSVWCFMGTCKIRISGEVQRVMACIQNVKRRFKDSVRAICHFLIEFPWLWFLELKNQLWYTRNQNYSSNLILLVSCDWRISFIKKILLLLKHNFALLEYLMLVSWI